MGVKFGYESLADRAGAAVSSVTAAVTNPAANAFDWLPYDYWQVDTAIATPQLTITGTAAETADYIAIAAHDLVAATDEWLLEVSSDGATWYYADATGWRFATAGVIFVSRTSASWQYYRLSFRRDAGATTFAPKIGLVAMGTMLELDSPQIGFAPTLSDGAKLLTNRSMGAGTFLGRSTVPQAEDMDLRFECQTPASVRSDIIPLHEHLKSKPCFISWDETNYADEAVLAWAERLPKLPKYTQQVFMDYNLKLKAVTS